MYRYFKLFRVKRINYVMKAYKQTLKLYSIRLFNDFVNYAKLENMITSALR